MTIPINVVNTSANADTFATMFSKVNQAINAISQYCVTVNAQANGSLSTGNGYVNGIFGGNTLVVFDAIRGGNVQTANVLTITSNVVSANISVGNSTVNTSVTSTTITLGTTVANTTALFAATFKSGNSTANLTANSIISQVSNSTATANQTPFGFFVGTSLVNSTVLAAGANVIVGTSDLKIGNTTANLTANSVVTQVANSTSIANQTPLGFFVGTSVVNSTVLAAGANVIVGTSDIKIGNSVANSLSSAILMQVANSTATANQTPLGFFVGTSVVNSTAIAAGANLIISTVDIKIGNSTINTVANSTGFFTAGAAALTANTRASVYVNSTATYTRSLIKFANNSNVTIDYADEAGNNAVLISIGAVINAAVAATGSNTWLQYNLNGVMGSNSGLAFTYTSNTLSVGNTIVVPNVNLTTLNFASGNAATSYLTFTSPNTSIQNVDSFPLGSYQSMDYSITIKDNAANGYQMSKVALIHATANSYTSEYAVIYSNASLGTFTSAVNATHCILRFIPVSANSTLKIVRNGITP